MITWTCRACHMSWSAAPSLLLPPPMICSGCKAVLPACTALESVDCGDFRVRVVAEMTW